jgi:hypothetical protein
MRHPARLCQPTCHACGQARDDRVAIELLRTLAALLAAPGPPRSAAAAALDRLALALPGRRTRLLYSCLGSGTRSKVPSCCIRLRA